MPKNKIDNQHDGRTVAVFTIDCIISSLENEPERKNLLSIKNQIFSKFTTKELENCVKMYKTALKNIEFAAKLNTIKCIEFIVKCENNLDIPLAGFLMAKEKWIKIIQENFHNLTVNNNFWEAELNSFNLKDVNYESMIDVVNIELSRSQQINNLLPPMFHIPLLCKNTLYKTNLLLPESRDTKYNKDIVSIRRVGCNRSGIDCDAEDASSEKSRDLKNFNNINGLPISTASNKDGDDTVCFGNGNVVTVSFTKNDSFHVTFGNGNIKAIINKSGNVVSIPKYRSGIVVPKESDGFVSVLGTTINFKKDDGVKVLYENKGTNDGAVEENCTPTAEGGGGKLAAEAVAGNDMYEKSFDSSLIKNRIIARDTRQRKVCNENDFTNDVLTLANEDLRKKILENSIPRTTTRYLYQYKNGKKDVEKEFNLIRKKLTYFKISGFTKEEVFNAYSEICTFLYLKTLKTLKSKNSERDIWKEEYDSMIKLTDTLYFFYILSLNREILRSLGFPDFSNNKEDE